MTKPDGNDEKEAAPFGLVGHPLGHSWSPKIHGMLGSVPYDLHDLAPDQVEDFVRNGSWRGLNVTIPYKPLAASLADSRSDRVLELGVANTLVRRPDGSIFADNTDVLGFSRMLEHFCRTELGTGTGDALAGRPVCVLGSGGASAAVQAALRKVGASLSVISRSSDDDYEHFLERHADVELLVNTTPVGMYPACPASALSLDEMGRLARLRGVLDVVYNPTRTGICLNAEKLGIPSESGLTMLVSQALCSSELFQNVTIDERDVERIRRSILDATENVVFIGMPGSGKTTTGKRLARMLGRPFVDVDDAIEQEEGRSPAQIIGEDGEGAFRRVETRVTGEYGARSGLVIACGGGVVTRPENYDLLHQNGRIVLVDRPLEQLSTAGRPMSQARGVDRLARERMDAYRSWADVTLRCTGSPAGDAQLARALLGL